MSKFLHKINFSCEVKASVSEDKSLHLALASIDKLSPFLPYVSSGNVDLLGISFNAAVINRVNKNDHTIDTQTALAIYRNFTYKQINTQHDRTKVCGVILTAGFSEFGSDVPLTPEEVSTTNDPFNLVLGGFIWRSVNDELANYLEECSDPTSEHYLKVSASWELGFSQAHILVSNGSRNVKDCTIIQDAIEIAKYEPYLRANGGDGAHEGKKIFRLIVNSAEDPVLPLGIGLTETPAAEVKGILVASPCMEKEDENHSPVVSEEQEKKEEVSLSSEMSVTRNESINMKKISKKEDITQEYLKEAQASDVHDFLAQEIEKISKQWETDKAAKDNAIKAAEEAKAASEVELATIKSQFDALKAELDTIKAKIEAQALQERFTNRMSALDSTFDLSAEDRSILQPQVKDLADDAFASFAENLKVLMSAKLKTAKTEEASVKEVKEVSASETKEEAKTVVENAIESATQTTVAPPNTTEAKATVKDKWRAAFVINEDDFSVNRNRK